MRELEDVTLKEVTDYIIKGIAVDRKVSMSQARNLLANALSYNLVLSEIEHQIDFLMETEGAAV